MIFFEPRNKQVAIPGLTVAASLRDVQAAAAQLTRYHGPPYGGTSVENTDKGVIVRGPWREPGGTVAGTWTATYEVQKAQPGRSTLSGTIAAALARPGDPLRASLEATATAQTMNLAAAAERVARQHSVELEPSHAEGAALPHTTPERPARVTLTGQLVADPVLRTTAKGAAVANFHIAVRHEDGPATYPRDHRLGRDRQGRWHVFDVGTQRHCDGTRADGHLDRQGRCRTRVPRGPRADGPVPPPRSAGRPARARRRHRPGELSFEGRIRYAGRRGRECPLLVPFGHASGLSVG